MKKFIFGILLAAGLSGTLSSCSGFLDKTPTNAVAASDALTNISDAGTAVNGFYTPLKYYTMYGTNNAIFGDVRADVLYSAKDKKSYDTVYRLQYNAVQNNYFSSFWGGYYEVINRVNTFLENIGPLYEKLSGEDYATLESYIAEAYAVRGFCYFELARLYGKPYTAVGGPESLGAVIVTETISASEAKTMTRSTVADTYKRAIDDLTEAEVNIFSEKNDGHFNRWAVKALLSRVHLYMGDYQKAYNCALEVINSNAGYALVERNDYREYWGHDNQPETVLEFLVSLKGDIDGDGGFYTIFHNMWFGIGDNAGYGLVPTKKWRDQFIGHESDIRYQMLEEYAPEGTVVDLWLKKFIGNKDKNFTFRRNSPRIIRMSEVYLNAAEAALHLDGKLADAAKYLHDVRSRRELGVEKIESPTLDDILNERFKEFIGEGHRFYDMMRCGKAIVHDYAYDPQDYIAESGVVTIDNSDYRVVLPIADSELGIYPELQQNPGY